MPKAQVSPLLVASFKVSGTSWVHSESPGFSVSGARKFCATCGMGGDEWDTDVLRPSLQNASIASINHTVLAAPTSKAGAVGQGPAPPAGHGRPAHGCGPKLTVFNVVNKVVRNVRRWRDRASGLRLTGLGNNRSGKVKTLGPVAWIEHEITFGRDCHKQDESRSRLGSRTNLKPVSRVIWLALGGPWRVLQARQSPCKKIKLHMKG